MFDDHLPVHPRTGLAALAVLDSGRVVWPVLGGADDGDAGDGGDGGDDGQGDGDDGGQAGDGGEGEGGQGDGDDGDADDDQDDDKPLGPRGEKALQAEKTKRRDLARRLREAEAENARLRGGDGDEAAQAKRDAEQAAMAKANARILRSEVKAAAAGKLANPALAVRLLDLDQFEVDDNGDVDEGEIADAIEELLAREPYLAAQQAGKPRFQGSADQGARKRTKAPTLDQQIAAAEKDGNWAQARRLKSAKLTQTGN